MASSWIEVSIQAHHLAVESMEDWLFGAGALSVTLKNSANDNSLTHAVLEPVPGEVRLWNDVIVVGLFAQDSVVEELIDALYLSAASLEIDLPNYQFDHLEDQEWTRTWLDNFKPMQFGDRFWVCPTDAAHPGRDSVVLRLDPGLAFGTGTHATTAQCLQWMGDQTQQSTTPFEALEILDYGCGSGILGIAGMLLGAKSAWAVDIDPQAVEATLQNASRNQVADNFHVMLASELPEIRVDLLFANILFKPLMELADTFTTLVKPGGHIVLSGLLVEQIEMLTIRYNHAFLFDSPASSDGWALLTASRR